VAATLDEIRQSNQAFSTHHRIIDAQWWVRDVVVISDRLYDRDGAVIGTHGFYVDVTPSDEARNEEVSAVVAEIAEHRAAIEQTKGMLMVIYRMTADTAFELLKWRSQKTNTTHPRCAALGRVPGAALRRNPAAPNNIRPIVSDRASTDIAWASVQIMADPTHPSLPPSRSGHRAGEDAGKANVPWDPSRHGDNRKPNTAVAQYVWPRPMDRVHQTSDQASRRGSRDRNATPSGAST
jgi:hypothetical protein